MFMKKRYRDLKTKLEAASEAAGEVDSGKESTLEEISAIVRRMNDALKDRKTMLAPQIKLLREVRKEYQDVDGEYSRKKQTYDKVAVGLEVERQSIEQVSHSVNRGGGVVVEVTLGSEYGRESTQKTCLFVFLMERGGACMLSSL
jgi:hypothetical protein